MKREHRIGDRALYCNINGDEIFEKIKKGKKLKKVILYTTHCPQCNILKQRLEEANIEYIEIDNVDIMQEIGMMSAPTLVIESLNFMEALKWVENKDKKENDID